MIIFDLDGTLADCEHRRHFVDPRYHSDFYIDSKFSIGFDGICCNSLGDKFKSDWESFFEACDKDKPIYSVIGTFKMMQFCSAPIQIWSGRCESVRDKTEKWLQHYGLIYECLKLRPLNDYTHDEVLKERWLNEAIAEGKTIDFVFDNRPKVVKMWRRRGIFVFDCNQTGKEF